MFKTAIILTVLVLFGLQISAQPNIGQFFNNLKNIVITNADKLVNWKNDAENAAKKTIKDFTACPSPAAQNLYDDLKRKQEQARETKRLADEADRQAQAARENCKRTTRLNAQCDAAYNSLAFKATSEAAGATIAALENALSTLRKLCCPAGCNQTARIVYPTIQLGERNVKVRDFARVPILIPPAGVPLPLPFMNEVKYCSVWKRGEFWANWDSGNGEFNGNVHAKLPQCERVETISVCTEWDLNLLLPKLQKLNIVPPSLEVGDLKIEIPNQDVTVISGVKQVECKKPIKIAKRSTVTFNFDLSSNPLSILTGQGSEMVEIGCAEPAFGLEPISNTVSLPDLTKVKISWKGITVKGGFIEIDMTKPEFQGICKKGFPSSIKVPTVKINKNYLDLPEVCLQPRLVDLVGRK